MNCVDVEMSCLLSLFLCFLSVSLPTSTVMQLSFLPAPTTSLPISRASSPHCTLWMLGLRGRSSSRHKCEGQPAGQDSASARLTLLAWDWVSRGLCKDAGSADKQCPWCSPSASPWPGVSVPAALSWSHSSCCLSFLGFNHGPSPVAQTSYGACVPPGILLLS